jgi:hypothetical protein
MVFPAILCHPLCVWCVCVCVRVCFRIVRVLAVGRRTPYLIKFGCLCRDTFH